MASCALANSDGFLAVVPDIDVSACSGYVMVTAKEYSTLMDYTQVTPNEISQAFGFGFTLVFVGGYLSTYAIKMAIRLIRLL